MNATNTVNLSAKTRKPRRKRIRARFVDGREAMQGWGYCCNRYFYVIDSLGVARVADTSCANWFAVSPEALALPDGEFAIAVATDKAGEKDVGYNVYERYIVDLCDKDGNVYETIR